MSVDQPTMPAQIRRELLLRRAAATLSTSLLACAASASLAQQSCPEPTTDTPIEALYPDAATYGEWRQALEPILRALGPKW